MQDIKYKDDYVLVDRYLCGDKCAGETLFANAYPVLQGYVINKTKNSILNDSDRDDIILDTLMIAVNKLNTFTGKSKFSTLVIGIARNKILEKFREKGADINNTIDIESITDMDSTSSLGFMGKNPLKIIIEKEEKHAILRAIEMLKPEYRQILELRLFNNMSFKQLSILSGKSEVALDSMYRRAIKSFKKNFQEIYF